MNETQKNQIWQIAEVFRGSKSSASLNDIIRLTQKDLFKDLVQEEFQNESFVKSVKFEWHCTAQDDSVEYINGKIVIDKDKLKDERDLFMIRPSFIDYGDGRSFFVDVRPDFLSEEATEAELECYGGIRYFRDGTVDPFKKAEDFIENFYSTARLLQMKVWWDTFPHETTPKLAAVYQWSEGVVKTAIAGQTTFEQPPFTFAEITEEIASLAA
jgi:hypothetical protein